MNTEKTQTPLAAILGEAPLISTHTEPSAFDEEPAPPTLANNSSIVEPALETAAVGLPSEPESAPRAQQAKSSLGGLNLDTAIRLRWAMRDIKAKRTKWSPVSGNDLAALIDLGFVEMREEKPRLTNLGFLALD